MVAFSSLFGSFTSLAMVRPLPPDAILTTTNLLSTYYGSTHYGSTHYGSTHYGQVLSFSPDEIPNALAHASKHREQLPYLVLSSVCGYVSVSFVLLMIKMYGATVTEMVKSLRKARAPTLTRTPTL